MELLRIEGLSKSFPGQQALRDVDLVVRRGEIHALVGQNGSGKSTLIKILAGYHRPDPGCRVVFAGQAHGLQAARATGRLRFVHQDLGLVPTMNTVENVALGSRYTTGFLRRIRWRQEISRTRNELRELGMLFDVLAPVQTLSPSEKTTVAIVRALRGMDTHRVLVLDEPTGSLTLPEVKQLFTIMRKVATEGSAVLFVTHRIDEVFKVADRVTVLRDGRVRAAESVEALQADELVALIVGRAITDLYPAAPYGQAKVGMRSEVALKVDDLVGAKIGELSFSVRAGEIVGIAGIAGSGREEVARILFGAQPARDGSIEIDGQGVRLSNPRAALAAGMALVPQDRASIGVFPFASVRENMTLPNLRPFVRLGRIDRGREQREAASWVDKLDIRPTDPEASVGKLSGGNQQKTLLARCLRLQPRVLILDEPTQGIDVGAKAAVYATVDQAAAAGTAVVVCSSDAEELARLCDRVLVLREGRLAIELDGSSLTEAALILESLQSDRVTAVN